MSVGADLLRLRRQYTTELGELLARHYRALRAVPGAKVSEADAFAETLKLLEDRLDSLARTGIPSAWQPQPQDDMCGIDGRPLCATWPNCPHAEGYTAPVIWWLSWVDTEAVYAMIEGADLRLPPYIWRQVDARRGFVSRGQLFCDEETVPHVSVHPWPDTPLARRLEGDYGGIVIRAGDMDTIRTLPGIVTDLSLNRLA